MHTENYTASTFSKVIAGMIVVFVLLISLLLPASFPPSVHAQGSGVVGILSLMKPVFSSQAANGCSAILKDIGQGSNGVFYNTAGGFIGTIDAEWSPTGSAPFFPITQAVFLPNGDSYTGRQLSWGGYYPNVRICVSNYAGGSLSAWYTSISGPVFGAAPALSSMGNSSPVTCDLSASTNFVNGTRVAFVPAQPFTPTDVFYICGVDLSFQGATVAGNVTIGFASDGTCTIISTGENILTTANTPQYLSVTHPISSKGNVNGHLTVSNWPCIINNSGSNVQINMSYASVRNL